MKTTNIKSKNERNSKEPFVSVCLVYYNQRKWLDNVIKTIKSTDYDNYKIVFVDNSRDGSVPYVKKNYPEVIALEKENLGFAGGHNLAVKQKKADYYMIHDMDIEHIDPLWLKKMIDFLENNPKAGMASGVIVPMHLRSKLDVNKIKQILPEPIKVHMVSGSFILVKNELYEKIGLFDDEYFIYWEETDFMYRALLYGYDVWWFNIPYLHYSGSSTLLREQTVTNLLNYNKSAWTDDKGNLKARGFYYYYRNEIMFYLINFGKWRLTKSMLKLFFRTGYHLTLMFHPRKIQAMYDSWKYIIKNFNTIMKKRKITQSNRVVKDSEIVKLHKLKDKFTSDLNSYYKQLEEEVMKEEKVERPFYH